jgi:hypothetical protein
MHSIHRGLMCRPVNLVGDLESFTICALQQSLVEFKALDR